MAFFHLGNTQKHQGFLGLPIAASCGGRLFPQSAKSGWARMQRSEGRDFVAGSI